MKSRLVLLLLAAHAGAALAQYKCTGANGAVTFQQTPCFGARAEEKLVVIPNGHPPPATRPASAPASGVLPPKAASEPAVAPAPAGKADIGVNRRMLAGYERQHERDVLEQAVGKAQDAKTRRAVQRAQAIAAAQARFGTDPANAAALRDALAAIDSRYNALGQIDDNEVRAAQEALDDWDRTQAAAAAAAAPSAASAPASR
jgi:hypothetical protein